VNLEKPLTIPAGNDGSGLLPKKRVAVLFHRFGPYHHARLNGAGRLMTVWGVEACATEDIYAWNKVEGASAFTRVTLTGRHSGGRRWQEELQQKMWRALDEIKPQVVVIPGWIFTDALSALWWCVKSKTPAVVMSESNAWDERRLFWKEWIKRRLVKLCSAGLVGGTTHADYLAQLGLPREQIFMGYDVVDNDYFAEKTAEAGKRPGLPERFFLASARFMEKKNLFRLIQAYARYRELAEKMETGKPGAKTPPPGGQPPMPGPAGHPLPASDGQGAVTPWDLVLLGDGPLKSELDLMISDLGLQPSVHLPGFKQYDELPSYYGPAAAFVHASTTEQWGLVVNEAMASGLPVLVSSRCGCAHDLVREGLNGFTFDPLDTEQLAQLMLKISAAGFRLSDFGAQSRHVIAGWGPERFGTGLKAAVTAALKAGPPSLNFFDSILLNALLKCKIRYDT
jgi:glycosyltransferase involved in cell wall biosynthesis